MNNALAKKVIIIFSVLIVTVAAAIIVAYSTGHHALPQLSDPDGIFYERTDADGNVVYSITNAELFEEIKGNDGLDQLLYMIDEHLLQDYIAALTDTEIADRIKLLTYGSADDEVINALDADKKAEYEATFEQSMILAGYSGHEEDYARIVLAREAYARFAVETDGDVTDMNVAAEFMSNYYKDVKAIKIRLTSSADALDVLRKFNLVTYSSTTLREYLGFIYNRETILWNHDGDAQTPDVIADAYITVTPYWINTDGDILDLDSKVVYEKGDGATYSDGTNEFTLLENGDLVDADNEVVIADALLFDTLSAAQTYKTDHTEYFTMSKVDAFDQDERAEVRNAAGDLVYTVGFDGKIYDLEDKDVTATTDITLNKVYKTIATMGTVTLNNSRTLTNAEVLTAFIKMYNYVYAEQRDAADLLDEAADANDLIASDNSYLTHNYTEVKAIQANLATYLFKTLDISKTDAVPYTATAKSYAGANDTSYYLIYKLTQPAKTNAYEIMLDSIENNIHLPAQTVDNLTLPTTGWYSAKITWTSEDTNVITNAGVVTLPATTPVDIDMTYKITANSVTRTGTITVTVLPAGGTTSTYDTSDPGTAPTFKTILNDPTLYGKLYQQLIDAKFATSDTAQTTVDAKLVLLRNACGLKIYDSWIAIDYQDTDTTFVAEKKGSDTLIATLDGTVGYLSADVVATGFEVTADNLFDYTLTKNPALYVLYASQYKELLYSSFFELAGFGTQTDLAKNKTDMMAAMYQSVTDAKNYYAYLQQLYASYGIAFPYTSFTEYAYKQYSTKSEWQLLEYFVQAKLQPYLIREAIDNYDLVGLLYDTVAADYQNFFSLDVTHLIIYLDFDENGSNDNYFDYLDSLTPEEADAFETKLAGFEGAITEYLDDADNSFSTLITAYRAATREDATWGEYKRYGFCLLTEDLNIADENDDTVTHSLNYSGTYGVKDTYVQEYVDALIALYQEYRLPQNEGLSELMSSLVTTQFGLHLILAQKGDDFDGFTAQFAEADPAAPVYTEGSVNPDGQPTLEQLKLYALYYFYNTVYDLTDTDVETLYGITVPKLPASVTTALKFFFDDLCANLYVVGTLNISMGDRLAVGRASGIDDAAFKAALAEVKDVYYQALFGQYLG